MDVVIFLFVKINNCRPELTAFSCVIRVNVEIKDEHYTSFSDTVYCSECQQVQPVNVTQALRHLATLVTSRLGVTFPGNIVIVYMYVMIQ